MAQANALPSGNGAIHQFFPNSIFAGAPVSGGYAPFTCTPQIADAAATLIVDFDESTNAALVTDIWANAAQYSIVSVGGTPQLQKNGQAVAIAAPSAMYQLQATILTGYLDATIRAAVIALWNGTATLAQTQKALAYCLLKLHQAGTI